MLADKYNQETVDIQEWLTLIGMVKTSNKRMLNTFKINYFNLQSSMVLLMKCKTALVFDCSYYDKH
jgi:hypothetical protein